MKCVFVFNRINSAMWRNMIIRIHSVFIVESVTRKLFDFSNLNKISWILFFLNIILFDSQHNRLNSFFLSTHNKLCEIQTEEEARRIADLSSKTSQLLMTRPRIPHLSTSTRYYVSDSTATRANTSTRSAKTTARNVCKTGPIVDATARSENSRSLSRVN